MVRLLSVCLISATLIGCVCNDVPTKIVTVTETVEVPVPVHVKVPDNIANLPPLIRPTIPVDQPSFFSNENYWSAGVDISESLYLLKNYTKQLETQNQLYRSYILSLPNDSKK